MKLLHFADLHLGIDAYGSADGTTGLTTRVNDFLRAFDHIVDHAIEERVDAVLFAGDAFKNRDPNPTLQREFARRIARLVGADIPIVLLVGNHDMPGALSRATAADIYEVLQIPGVSVVRELDLIKLDTVSGTLQVVAVPWITRSILLSDEEFRRFADEDLDVQIRSGISYQVRKMIECLDPALPAVLLAHVSLQGADFGLERSIMLGRDVTVAWDDLNASAFDYVALGHIHKHQQLGARPPVIYSGSPERVDFGEEDEAKGFVMVEIETGTQPRNVNWEFITLPARRFETIRIDAHGDAPLDRVRSVIHAERGRIRDAVVRCFVAVDGGWESSVNPLEVRRMLEAEKPFAVARIVVESDTTQRARLELDVEDALDLESMLQRWVDSKDYDREFRERLMALGADLIRAHREGKD